MELTGRQGRRKSDSRDTASMKNIYAWKEMEAEGRREEETASQACCHGRLSGLSSVTSPGEFTLTTYDFYVLPVLANGFQDELVHRPSRH